MTTRPNVLWIMADQLRYQALGSSGDPNASTPNLDRLASEGVRCTQATSQYPVCVPFRASLMTGLYAHQNGTLRHGDFLDPSLLTVAHAFEAAGYRTSYTGKWHLAPEIGAHMVTPEGWIGQEFWVHPNFRGGFRDWFGFNLSNNYLKSYYCTGEKIAPIALDGYQTDALTDLSLDYLGKQAHEEPWFHVLSYESPHPGSGGNPRSRLYPVPESYESRFEPAELRLRENVPAAGDAAAREQLAGYYRLIANLDDNVGRVLDWLDRVGLAERTLVVFLSDHGEMGGSHGLRNKQVPYEESLHVPAMWRWPGVLPAGVDYNHPTCGVDFFPTTAGLCDVPVPAEVQGLDLAPVFRAGADTPLRDAVLVQWEAPRFAFGDHPYRALRSSSHTYVVGRDDAFCMLFEHRGDPWQLRNLFFDPASAPLRRRLHEQLVGLLDAVGERAPEYVDARAP